MPMSNRSDFKHEEDCSLQSIPIPTGNLLTVKEVAARLTVSSDTVYRLIDTKQLRAHLILGSIRIHPASLADYFTRSQIPMESK